MSLQNAALMGVVRRNEHRGLTQNRPARNYCIPDKLTCLRTTIEVEHRRANLLRLFYRVFAMIREVVTEGDCRPTVKRGSGMSEVAYPGADGCLLHATIVGHPGELAEILDGSVIVMLHGGGLDHRSLIPLAQRLADRYKVVLPDIRGYGRSVCTDPARHTWTQYADDIIALLVPHRSSIDGYCFFSLTRAAAMVNVQ